jgi:hypothetical protein
MIKDTRLNINLFKTFCLPQFRLGFYNSIFSSKCDREKYCLAIKKILKKFCLLPLTTPNRIIEKMIGDIEQQIELFYTSIITKETNHQKSVENLAHLLNPLPESPTVEPITPWKFYPKKIVQPIWIL